MRMRRGKAADSLGAPEFVSEALATAVEADCTGLRILRADSQCQKITLKPRRWIEAEPACGRRREAVGRKPV
ncbi:hypothetical protein [Streptomyces sp. DASNCL29]|uniref:hypothetical protein n=1 Tax=Streptomyces sp. DASNCL29 TaxID=2583819 RepID=UPI00110FB0CB|nr:hypothetical protein [Streptomyces sp. DASNCL29]TMU98426.1 hypothetical protein FGK60_11830 [Streptomyces sp. DASNCL29]